MAKRARTHFLDTFAGLRRGLASVIDEVYAPLGIGSTQAKLLRAVGASQPISQAELARATDTDPAAVGRALRTLVTRGWLRRRRSRDDGRAFSLELTPAGDAILKQALRARDALAVRMSASLEERDLVAFERIAKKLIDALSGS
jgi:DNA-binding MarR family transcriptional regulator